MRINPKQIEVFQKKIMKFYEDHGRKLPWRYTKNPYYILVSEIMLQQTQVSRVIKHYQKWITTWPTIFNLADASFEAVLKQWIGLGYNRRAKYLHQTASIICQTYQGNVLDALKDYTALPGIGIYTSTAVRIFAANEDIVAIDTNIRRILIHEFHLPHTIAFAELKNIANHCLPKGHSRDWHNALMDYGALYLTSKKTGISPETKQSPFKGSDREIRGLILKQLLIDAQNKEDLQEKLTIPSSRLDRIISSLSEEGFLIEENGILKLKQ